MVTASTALSAIPAGLRDPLIAEYQSILQNYLEHRWLPSELSGGRFSEVVYTILNGHAKNMYAATPAKPGNFVQACRDLENNGHVPRSFQILIPRLLPALYEIRNNRSVGHVGGDVDPNHMDSGAVLSMCNWVMGELVRVFHNLGTAEAQKVVDTLVELRIPIVWSDGGTKRVLQPSLKLPDQILLLTATSVQITSKQIIGYTECGDKKYFFKVLRGLHSKRFVEFNETDDSVKILPPGTKYVEDLIRKKNLTTIV